MNNKGKSCISNSLKQLLEEQKQLAGESYKFICNPYGMDTIPFMLSCSGTCELFTAVGYEERKTCFSSTVFRLEKLELDSSCAKLRLLKAVDMDGCPIDNCSEVYSLIKTDQCITVDLTCFCVITPLPPKLVNRPLPIIEPKC